MFFDLSLNHAIIKLMEIVIKEKQDIANHNGAPSLCAEINMGNCQAAQIIPVKNAALKRLVLSHNLGYR